MCCKCSFIAMYIDYITTLVGFHNFMLSIDYIIKKDWHQKVQNGRKPHVVIKPIW